MARSEIPAKYIAFDKSNIENRIFVNGRPESGTLDEEQDLIDREDIAPGGRASGARSMRTREEEIRRIQRGD